VLRLLHNAVVPPKRYVYRLDHPEYRYRDDACFPSELKEFRRNTFQYLSLDADSVHMSRQNLDAIEQTLHCRVGSERLGEKEGRPNIEVFFRTIAQFCEWLPSATGNRSDSPARRNPEAAAQRNYVSMALAEELLDIHCRNYNVSPQLALGFTQRANEPDRSVPTQWTAEPYRIRFTPVRPASA
jgi:hypothetical protein